MASIALPPLLFSPMQINAFDFVAPMPAYFHSTPTSRFYVSSTLANNAEDSNSLKVISNRSVFKHHLEKYFGLLFKHPKCQLVVKVHIFKGTEECFGELVSAVSITVLQVGVPLSYFLVGITLCDAMRMYHLVLRNNCRLIGIFGNGEFDKKWLEVVEVKCREEVERIRGVLNEVMAKR